MSDPAEVAAGRSFGKYQLVQEIGRGGMGVVYRAWDKTLKRTVALKMLIAGETASDDEEQRLYTEATSNARISHPNILPVFEVGRQDGRLYFTMEFLKGKPFDTLMLEKGVDLRRGIEILRDVARALDYAHTKQILHRDVKPSNIMLADDGKVYLMDFGLARNIRETGKLTQTGFVMGTPNYMSPEQCRGERETLDGRSDVFGLGSVMYEFLTGRPPFDNESMLDILMAVLQQEPVPPGLMVPDLNEDLETICLKALRKDREMRYPRANALADDLDRWLRGEPIEARPETTLERMKNRFRRRRGLYLTLGGAAIAVAVSLSLGISAMGRSSEAEKEREALRLAQERRARAGDHFKKGTASADIAEKCLMTGRTGELGQHWKDAVQALDEALREDAEFGEAWSLRGRVRSQMGQREAALGDLDEAIRRDPKNVAARYERGKVLLAAAIDMTAGTWGRGQAPRGDAVLKPFQEIAGRALADMEAVIEAKSDPPPWMILHARGARAFLNGDPVGALAGLNEAVAKNPFLDDALDLRGFCRLSQGEIPAALTDFEAAVKVNPLNVTAHNHRGVALGSAGRLEEAVESYREALRIHAGFVRARINLGVAFVDLGKPELALAELGRALDADPENLQGLETRGRARLALGQLREAGEDFTRVLEKNPESIAAWIGRAAVRRLQSNQEEALADASKALALDSRSIPAWLEKSLAAEAKGQWDVALEGYGQVLEIDAGNLDALANRAALHSAAGRGSDARADLEAFLRSAGPVHPRRAEVEEALNRLRQ